MRAPTSGNSSRRDAVRRLLCAIGALAVAAALVAVGTIATPTRADAATAHTSKLAATYARNMLRMLNGERADHHLRPLRMNSKLITSAHRHNLRMAVDDTMSHQLPGEAFFADRITRAGYKWYSAGENIGWNSDESNRGLLQLESDMYQEKAPDNGHRLNILSKSFREVGIDVYFDAKHGKIWFTQDFGQPA